MNEARLITAYLLALGLAACSPNAEGPASEEAEEQAEEQADLAQETFNRTAKSRIDATQERAEQLEERIDKVSESVREDLDAQLEDWRRRADDLEARIDEFEATSPQQWQEFEARVTAELAELDRTFQELSQRVESAAAD